MPRFELDIDQGCLLRGNETELYSIASNLISNAIKYTPRRGHGHDPVGPRKRRRATRRAGHRHRHRAEHLPRLTERFYRVDRARARAKGGSGLGLSIVKHGLQRHGGRLDIESEEGHGSTFTAHFPARRVMARLVPVTKAS